MTELERRRPPSALYVRRPAEITKRDALFDGETWTAGEYEKHYLKAAAANAQRKGEITILRNPVWHEESRQWRMVVQRTKAPAPAWRKPVIISSIALAILGGIGLALATLVTPAVIGALVLVLVVFVVAVLWSQFQRVGGRRSVDVSVKVRVR